MRLLTIGFTKKSARSFFESLKDAGVRQLVDVRLNNVSQLSGFAKRADLKYFLETIGGIGYSHELQLAPTKSMLDGYKKLKQPWNEYEASFRALMIERRIEDVFNPESLHNSVLLCSEATAHNCHRRLVAEHLAAAWGDTSIVHL